jgi:uroporphyrinogen III methyltransferase/synthase
MTNLSPVLRVGTRKSKLALIQTEQVIRFFETLVPSCQFQITECSSPGDRDQQMNLKTSPSDFFTKDLDDALLEYKIDAAIHSAKDLPPKLRDGIDWCWLPLREDPRDVLILPENRLFDTLPLRPRIGISSDRRESWCLKQFPDAQLVPIRGTIERRLEQLDNGDYDLVIMAAAALIRLCLEYRISRWIDADDLQVPDGQGVLALTFRNSDPFWTQLRKLFVKQVAFAGAGCGRSGTSTIETLDALSQSEVCIYDALLDKSLLDNLPRCALKIDAGKRLGEHTLNQSQINQLIADYARRGLQVTRLKGGDPGIFGRLAEETDTLDKLTLPYQVFPGISSLQCATTGTGMLLTRRGLSRGFCVITPRSEGGAIANINQSARGELPQVYFMGLSSIDEICNQLITDGTPASTSAAIIFGAGSFSEHIIKGTIESLPGLSKNFKTSQPGIIIIGAITNFSFQSHGALGGKRILVTCSDALQKTALRVINEMGGIPIPYPAIKLTPCADGLKDLTAGEQFDWLILTSPSAVHSLMSMLLPGNIDIRSLPPIVVSGEGTAKVLLEYHLKAAIVPDKNFGAEGLIQAVAKELKKGQRILRLRSDKAGDALSSDLEQSGFSVTDRVICINEPVHSGPVPEFDTIFFASSSAVASLLDRPDPISLSGKTVLAIGVPTSKGLIKRGINKIISGAEASTESAIKTYAIHTVRKSIECATNKGKS